MCNQRLDNVGILLAHIDYDSTVDSDQVDLTTLPTEEASTTVGLGEQQSPAARLPDAMWDVMFEHDFQLALRHYLVQRGHPDTEVIRAMVGADFERDRNDEFLRSRLFLRMMSGSDLIPTERDWVIKVSMLMSSYLIYSADLRTLPRSLSFTWAIVVQPEGGKWARCRQL